MPFGSLPKVDRRPVCDDVGAPCNGLRVSDLHREQKQNHSGLATRGRIVRGRGRVRRNLLGICQFCQKGSNSRRASFFDLYLFLEPGTHCKLSQEDSEMPKFDVTKLNVAIDRLLEVTEP